MSPRLAVALIAVVVGGASLWPSSSPIGHVSAAALVARPASASAAASARLRRPHLPLRFHSAPMPAPRKVVTPRATGSRIAVFNGLNQPGLSFADSTGGVPPDSTGSIGPNFYVETVNAVIGVYKRSDLSLVGSAVLFDTWLSSAASLCDPQIQWDPSSQRWLYVVLDCAFGDDQFLFGWSRTPDPSDLSPTGWCEFSEPTPGVLSDYPKLGHNGNYMLVGTNDFGDGTGNPFVTAQIFWMNTPAAGVSTCTAPTVQQVGTAGTPLKNGDGSTLTGTPVPVNTSTSAANGYVVSAYDPSGPPPAPQTKLALWHLDSAGGLHQDTDITVKTYAVPGPAPDLGGDSHGLDTLDGRLTQAVGDPTTGIYTQHTVNGAGGRSKVTWYEIQVVASAPSLTQEGDISSATDYVFNASISPRSDGQGAAIFYNRSSAAIDPVAAGQSRTASTPSGQMDPGEIVLATSSGGDTDFSCNFTGHGEPCRWGDYSGASPDPMNASVVWGSNQTLFTPVFNFAVWLTENYAVLVLPGRTASQSGPPPVPGSRDPAHQSGTATPPPR